MVGEADGEMPAEEPSQAATTAAGTDREDEPAALMPTSDDEGRPVRLEELALRRYAVGRAGVGDLNRDS